ncbi:MAG: hypothetical protein K6G55_09475 [Selenomonadaceae bacterium]|nr:hypothetical protein [Selenomonadaceae bacterium]
MSGTFDYFGRLSHLDYTAKLTAERIGNRKIFHGEMIRHGFCAIDIEWWHFTLNNKPYPDVYFTFPVTYLNKSAT